MMHQDPLHFLRRVAAYRAALGQETSPLVGFSYVAALATGCPTLAVGLLVTVWGARRFAPPRIRSFARWMPSIVGVGALLAFLMIGAGMGGAPTHHPERALLLVWFLGAALVVDFGASWLAHLGLDRPWISTSRVIRLGVLAVGLVLLGSWDFRRQLGDFGLDRRKELAVGSELRTRARPGERVLVATDDYGYFAIMAAFGRPFDVAVDMTHDPRSAHETTAFSDADRLAAKVKDEHASFIVAPVTRTAPSSFSPVLRAGSLVLYGAAER